MICQCPYCTKDYTTWYEVVNHTKNCNKNNYTYAIHKDLGPVSVTVFNSLAGEELNSLYGNSFVNYAKEKFKKNGTLTQVFKKAYSKEYIITLIKEYYNIYAKVPRGVDFNNLPNYPHSRTVINRFGSWNTAIAEAGLPINKQFGGKKAILINKDDVIKNLQELAIKLDRTPTVEEYKDIYSINALIKIFGKWSIALQEANLAKSDLNTYSKEYIISTLIRAYKEDGYLTIQNYLQKNYAVSKDPINRVFGSWSDMLIALDIPTNIPSSLYGIPTLAKDGHTYLSRLESTFVNKFLYNKYEYIIEPNYPDSTWRYDWCIPSLDMYIELYGGLRPERLAEKIQLNKLLNRKLLIVTKKDIDNNSELEEILKNVSE